MAPNIPLTGINDVRQAIATPPKRQISKRRPPKRRMIPLLLGMVSPILLSACTQLPLPEAQEQNATELTAQIQASLQPNLDELLRERFPDNAPGVAVLVTYNNQILYAQGHGLSNVEQNIPITPETVFDIASVTKSMTAVAILQLQEQGKLALDEPVIQHLPDFKDPNPDEPILISHLLHHTSGLVDYIEEWDLENDPEGLQQFDLAQLLPWLNQQKPRNRPGIEFYYNDTGYALLALIVQQASGQSFPVYMAENIFEPAGMTQTRLYQTLGETFPRQAQGYQTADDQAKAVAYPILMMGDGNIFTSLTDFARYDQALRQGKLIEPASQDLIFQDGVLNDGRTIGQQAEGDGYGAGLGLTPDYGHHIGGWAGMGSYYRFYTQQPLSIVVLANSENLDTQELGEAIASLASAEIVQALNR